MFADLKYLKQHPFQLVSMIAIALIPLIYSAVFIGSMWNPYNETGSLTVDIVIKMTEPKSMENILILVINSR